VILDGDDFTHVDAKAPGRLMMSTISTRPTTSRTSAGIAAGGPFTRLLVLAGAIAVGGCVQVDNSTPTKAATTPRTGNNSATQATQATPTNTLEHAPTTRTIPAGTGVTARLDTTLDSSVASVGDEVKATTTSDVRDSNGLVALPAGTVLTGQVTAVESARKVHKMASLSFRFDRATLSDGRTADISASEGVDGKGWTKKQGGIIGGSAAGGAVLGQVLGHDTKSTIEGAIVGGAIAAGVVMSHKGEDVVISSGSSMDLTLDGAVEVNAPLAS
jgi:hypothetical protein